MSRFEAAFGKWVVRHRWWLIVATVITVIVVASGMRFLTFNNDTRVFFSEDNPQLQALEALEDAYSKNSVVFFAIAPRAGSVFTRETLSAVEALTEAAWEMPHVDRVNSITNFQHTSVEGDQLLVHDLVQGAEALSEAELRRIEQIALSEPLLVNRLISRPGHVTGVNVNFLLPGESLDEVPAVATAARRIADELRRGHPEIEVHLAGGVMSDDAFGEASRNDMATLIPLMLLTLVVVVGFSLESGELDGINDPEYLAVLEEFANWYREQPKVVHVSALTDTLKRLNKNLHGDADSHYRIPDRRDLAAQYLLLYEMSLPAGLDLTNEINPGRSATRMIATMTGANTSELRATDEKARAWLKTNAPESMFTYGSGLSIIWAHISERNINSMLGASIGALALISVILIFALRSLRLGFLSLIPNLAPAIMAFGVWGVVVGRAGLGLTIVASMTIGVVDDDSVHFLSKYLRARREKGLSPSAAVRYSFETVGAAMSITTLALVSGLMVLSLSGYKMNSDLGLMAAMTIAIAFAMDVLFLPALLMKADARNDPVAETDLAVGANPLSSQG